MFLRDTNDQAQFKSSSVRYTNSPRRSAMPKRKSFQATVPAEPVPVDPTRINASSGREVIYWTAKLKCSWPQLANAVKQVGTNASTVETFLRRR
jgi:hypothetical protein